MGDSMSAIPNLPHCLLLPYLLKCLSSNVINDHPTPLTMRHITDSPFSNRWSTVFITKLAFLFFFHPWHYPIVFGLTLFLSFVQQTHSRRMWWGEPTFDCRLTFICYGCLNLGHGACHIYFSSLLVNSRIFQTFCLNNTSAVMICYPKPTP